VSAAVLSAGLFCVQAPRTKASKTGIQVFFIIILNIISGKFMNQQIQTCPQEISQ
jgi:hypothetical protein